MPSLLTAFKKHLQILLVCATAIILASCAPTPTKDEQAQETLSLDSLPQFLEDARQKEPSLRQADYLLAIEFLLQEDEQDWARELLRNIETANLSDTNTVRYLYLQGNLALQSGEPYLAKRYLFSETLEEKIALVPTTLAAQIYDLRATLLLDLAEYEASVSERILRARLLLDDEIETQLNNDLLWEALMELPYEDLKARARTENDEVKQGWFSLAANAKNQKNNLQQQLEGIDNWLAIWADHPAAAFLPADLQLIRQLADEMPRQVAVLLPLSGRLAAAGEAIRDGFMAAYFKDKKISGLVPSVRFYDTADMDIQSAYDTALLNGANLVIGPLDKDQVAELAARPDLAVPTLALNALERSNKTEPADPLLAPTEEVAEPFDLSAALIKPSNMYNFSLAVESEARQVAEKAWRDGHRRALILAPASNWGDRGVNEFKQAWENLGGEVVEEQRFAPSGNYSPQISQALDIDGSNQRRRYLQQMLGSKLEFEPRRRHDIDFVFLLAYSEQAQQLKPLLAFHYAGDLSVYSTSVVYDGNVQNKNVRDLNNIRFTTLPWFFDNELEEKRAITAYSKVRPGFQSLYALGVDAYHIYPRLKQFAKFKQARFYGATGRLSLSEDHQIQRQQIWAEIVNGQAVPLLTAISDEQE